MPPTPPSPHAVDPREHPATELTGPPRRPSSPGAEDFPRTVAMDERLDAGDGRSEAAFPTAGAFGRYHLQRELGRGGMGVVWQALDTELERPVAVKMLRSGPGEADRSEVSRFVREARLAAKLHHPNILAVHDVGVIDGRHYLTADLIRGRSLAGRTCVSETDAVPVRKAVQWIRTVADALQHAHDQDVVHRDVKPGNILIDERERPIVSDFGLAKEITAAGPERASGRLTLFGAIVGTPEYMSPEQALGEGANAAADQFSLGVVLYEMLTGHLPFAGDTAWETMQAVARNEPVPITVRNPRVHRELETICGKAMEKDPAARYGSMSEMAADLGRYLEGEPILARPLTTGMRLLRLAHKHRSVVGPVALAMILAFAGFTWLARDAQRERAAAEERERALVERERQVREKSYRVARVMSRWAVLGPELREIERWRYHTGMLPLGRALHCAQALTRVERELRSPGEDSATRATVLALTGYARWMAGLVEDGLERMQEAGRVDPDVPFGALMEALTLLSEHVDEQFWPHSIYSLSGVSFRMARTETARAAWRRDRMEVLLRQAGAAPVWGIEGASAYQWILAGIHALEAGALREAEHKFTAALRLREVTVFEGGLLMARARVRYHLKEFAGSTADLLRVARLRPDQAGVRFGLGLCQVSDALENARTTEVRLEMLGRALARFQEARVRNTSNPDYSHVRSIAGWFAAHFAKADGGDARSWLREAAADSDEAIRLQPSSAPYRRAAGRVWTDLGLDAEKRKEDGRGFLDRAIVELNEGNRLRGGDPSLLASLYDAQVDRGRAEVRHGGDPLRWFRAARAVLETAADPTGADAAEAESWPADSARRQVDLAGTVAAAATAARLSAAERAALTDLAWDLLHATRWRRGLDREQLASDSRFRWLRADPRWSAMMEAK